MLAGHLWQRTIYTNISRALEDAKPVFKPFSGAQKRAWMLSYRFGFFTGAMVEVLDEGDSEVSEE